MEAENVKALVDTINQLLEQQREMLARIKALESFPVHMADALREADPLSLLSGNNSTPAALRDGGAAVAETPARLPTI